MSEHEIIAGLLKSSRLAAVYLRELNSMLPHGHMLENLLDDLNDAIKHGDGYMSAGGPVGGLSGNCNGSAND